MRIASRHEIFFIPFFTRILPFPVVLALYFVEHGILAASLQQLIVCAFFCNAAVSDQNDTVTEAGRGKAM